MKLHQLHLFEAARCHKCRKRLTSDDIQHMNLKQGRTYCQRCGLRDDKQVERENDEDQNKREREQDAYQNMQAFSQQVPDRGYDKDRGTPGWLAGEPSPGRGGF